MQLLAIFEWPGNEIDVPANNSWMLKSPKGSVLMQQLKSPALHGAGAIFVP